MGYACPVCGDPQLDGEHLANHLAISAVMGHADHEAWLEEHAPGWDDQGPDELGPRVTEHAVEREFPQVFDDTTGHDHEHDHGDPAASFEDELARQTGQRGRGARTVDDAVYEEARRMTEAMQGGGEEDAGEGDTEDAEETAPDRDAAADGEE